MDFRKYKGANLKIKNKYKNDFFNLFSELEEIKELRKKVIEKETDNLSDLFINRILEFIEDCPLEGDDLLLEKQIIYNFWNMLFLYFFQKTFSIERSESTLKDYINCCSRILEFSIFVNNNSIFIFQNNEEIKIKNIFFDDKLIDSCFFKRFKEIKNKIKSNYEDLIVVKKNQKVKRVFINNEYSYEPKSKPVEELKDNKNETFWFERHFRLNNDQIEKIFLEIGTKGSEGGDGASKGSSFDYKEFDVHEYIEEKKHSKAYFDEIHRYEDSKEDKDMSSQLPSIFLDKKMQGILGVKLKDDYVKDKYKQYLLNKAISNGIAKSEMFLQSKVVNFSIFKILIQILLDEIVKKDSTNDIEKKEENTADTKDTIKDKDLITMILLSIFTGIRLKILILIFANVYKGIGFDKNFKKLIINNSKVFAENVFAEDDILIPIKSSQSEVYLPSHITDLAKSVEYNFKNEINKKNSEDCEKYLKDTSTIFSKCLNKIIKNSEFSNFNIIDIKSCHKSFYNYFKLFHIETDIRILLINNVSKSDETRICYTNQPKRAIYYEGWLNEFYNRLTSNNYVVESFYQTENVGSKKVFEKHSFKNFLVNLTYLEAKDNIQKFNLRMIFIRYSLALLLATRKGLESCNLSNFSESLGLLIIHEKAKTIRSSRRLIPLNKRTISLIKSFYELKKELQVSTNIPILLKYENEKRVEIDLNHNAVKTFIEEFKDHCKYEDVKKFVNVVDLNFGRHVFATEILKRGYDRNYGNEFLGHTSRGNSLFGIYSCLDTNEYINETKKFIDEIEEEYFPRNINVENIK